MTSHLVAEPIESPKLKLIGFSNLISRNFCVSLIEKWIIWLQQPSFSEFSPFLPRKMYHLVAKTHWILKYPNEIGFSNLISRKFCVSFIEKWIIWLQNLLNHLKLGSNWFQQPQFSNIFACPSQKNESFGCRNHWILSNQNTIGFSNLISRNFCVSLIEKWIIWLRQPSFSEFSPFPARIIIASVAEPDANRLWLPISFHSFQQFQMH